MSLYWISWHQPTEDCRPLTFPPNEAVLGWWCSGEDAQGRSTLCAYVLADDADAAEKVILTDWPEADDWRFCDKQSRVELGGRFPVSDWMKPRIDAAMKKESE